MTYMTEGMLPDTYILLFTFFGLGLVGLASLVLVVYIGLQRIITPKPQTKWKKEWAEIEKDLGGGE
jgi:hypothetical protein